MTTFSAVDLNSKTRHMGAYGNAMKVYGTVTPTTGAAADVYKPVRIPAGMTVTGLKISNAKLDTGGTSFAVKIGYVPVDSNDGPAVSDAYFSAATTILSNPALTDLRFDPIKFEFPVDVIMTVTTPATTFASAAITAIVEGIAIGRH